MFGLCFAAAGIKMATEKNRFDSCLPVFVDNDDGVVVIGDAQFLC